MGKKIYASVIAEEGIALFALEPVSGEWSRETPGTEGASTGLGDLEKIWFLRAI